MSIDVPDYSRGIVAAQVLLATVAAGVQTADIAVPPTVTALWLWSFGTYAIPPVTVVGDQTGAQYPVYEPLVDSTQGNGQVPFIALVSPVLDQTVTVTWSGAAPSSTWYVVGDTSMRVVANLAFVPVTPD